jgi:hypothetical protein
LALGTARLWPVSAFALCTFGKAQQERNAAKIVQSTAKAIAEVKRMLVERQVLRNFTMPLAVGKA